MPGKGFDQNYLDAQSNAEKQEGKRFTSTLKDDDFDAFKHYLQELKKSNSNATISYETDANDGIGAPAWKPQTISIDDFLSGLDSGGSASLPKFRFLPYINSTDVQSVYLFDQIFDALKANDHKKVDALLDSEMNGAIDQKDLDEYGQEMAAAYRIYNHDMDQEITRIGSVLEGIVLQSSTSNAPVQGSVNTKMPSKNDENIFDVVVPPPAVDVGGENNDFVLNYNYGAVSNNGVVNRDDLVSMMKADKLTNTQQQSILRYAEKTYGFIDNAVDIVDKETDYDSLSMADKISYLESTGLVSVHHITDGPSTIRPIDGSYSRGVLVKRSWEEITKEFPELLQQPPKQKTTNGEVTLDATTSHVVDASTDVGASSTIIQPSPKMTRSEFKAQFGDGNGGAEFREAWREYQDAPLDTVSVVSGDGVAYQDGRHEHTAGSTYNNELDDKTLRKTKDGKDNRALRYYLNNLEGDDVIDTFGSDYEAIFGEENLRNGEENMVDMLRRALNNDKVNAISAMTALDTFTNTFSVPNKGGKPDYSVFVDRFMASGLKDYHPQQKMKDGKLNNNEERALRKIAQAYVYSTARMVTPSGKWGKFYASQTYRDNVKNLFDFFRVGQSDKADIVKQIKAAEQLEWDKESDNLIDFVAGLLGDANVDGTLGRTNIDQSNRQQEKYNKNHNPDVMGVSGAAVAQALVDAKKDWATIRRPSHISAENAQEFAEGQLVKGVVALIKGSLNYGPYMDKLFDALPALENVDTTQELLTLFQERPTLKVVLQDAIRDHAEEVHTMFSEGPDYVLTVVERWKNQDEVVAVEESEFGALDNLSDTDATGFEKEMTSDQLEKIDQYLNKEYADYLTGLREEIAKASTELNEDGTPKYDPQDVAQLEASYKSLQSPNAQKDNIKLWKHNLCALGASFVEGAEGGVAGANFALDLKAAKEKNPNAINKALSAAFDSFNVTPGVAGQLIDGKLRPYLGAAVTLSARRALNKNETTHVLYAVGAGAGLVNGRLLVGPTINLGLEQQLNKKSLTDSLDPTSAQYIGAMLHSTLVQHGASIYWRRDKLEGLTQQRASIKEGFKGVVASVLTSPSMTQQEIETKLQAAYPKSHGEGISAFAADLHQLLVHYNTDLVSVDARKKAGFAGSLSEDEKSRSFGKIQEIIADTMANRFWNENVEEIASGGYHLSGVALGAALVAGYMPLPAAGIKITDYKTPTYHEYDESVKRADEVLGKGLGERMLDVSPEDFVNRLNQRFELKNGFGFEKYQGEKGSVDVVTISVDALQAVKLHITPELKQFVTYKEGKLIIPATMKMNLTRMGHAEHAEYHMILGNRGLKRYLDQSVYTDAVDDPETTKNEAESSDNLSHIEQITSLDAFANHEGDPSQYEDHLTTLKMSKANLEQTIQELQKVIGANANLGKVMLDGSSTLLNFNRIEEYDGGVRVAMVDKDGKDTNTYFPPSGTLKSGELAFSQDKDGLKVRYTEGTDVLKVSYGATFEFQKYLEQKAGFGQITETTKLNTDVNAIDVFMQNKGALTGSDNNLSLFMQAAEAGEWEQAKAAIPDSMITGLGIQRDKLTPADISNLFANTSRVDATKYKQLDAGSQNTIIDTLGATLKLSDAVKTELKTIAARGSRDLTDQEIKYIKDTLKISLPGGYYTDRKGDAYDLAWMLADMKMVVTARTPHYARRMKAENNNASLSDKYVSALMSWRAKSTENLKGARCDENNGYQTLSTAVGAVARYAGEGNAIDEKYVVSPTIACAPVSLNAMGFNPDTSKAMRNYFVTNFEKQSPGILKTLLKGLNETYGSVLSQQDFVSQLINTGSINLMVNGQEKTITPDFKFGWYSHCINESLLLDFKLENDTFNANVEAEEVRMGNVSFNNYDVMLEAQSRRKDIALGAVAGSREKTDNRQMGTDPRDHDPEGPGSNPDDDTPGDGTPADGGL